MFTIETRLGHFILYIFLLQYDPALIVYAILKCAAECHQSLHTVDWVVVWRQNVLITILKNDMQYANMGYFTNIGVSFLQYCNSTTSTLEEMAVTPDG